MNRKLFGICLLFLAVVSTGIVYLMARPAERQEQSTETNEMAIRDRMVAPAVSSTVEESPGSYIDYTDGIIEATTGTKILFFHAPWCPQCRSLEADIKANMIPADLTIFKVDYDNAQSLRQKYGVTLQTTMVRVDDTGQFLKKFVVYDDPTLASVITNVL